MANYYCTIRTNYFHVKDPAKFEEFMQHVYGAEDNIRLFKETDMNGNPLYGFGCYGGISGYLKEPNDEDADLDSAYDDFINGLHSHVAENDAVVLMTSGHEKLQYVVGGVTVITAKETGYIDMNREAVRLAKLLLDDPNWETKTAY